MTRVIHCIPLDDERPHDESPACWCEPQRDKEDHRVVIHNAADMREEYERIVGEPLPGKQWGRFEVEE